MFLVNYSNIGDGIIKYTENHKSAPLQEVYWLQNNKIIIGQGQQFSYVRCFPLLMCIICFSVALEREKNERPLSSCCCHDRWHFYHNSKQQHESREVWHFKRGCRRALQMDKTGVKPLLSILARTPFQKSSQSPDFPPAPLVTPTFNTYDPRS